MSTAAHKYGARATVYNGQRYPSKAEADYARELDLRQAAGEIVSWRRGTPAVLVPGGRGERITYKPDFEVVPCEGEPYWVEVKGYETAAWKLKRRLLKHLRPGLRLLVVTKEGEQWV